MAPALPSKNTNQRQSKRTTSYNQREKENEWRACLAGKKEKKRKKKPKKKKLRKMS